MSSKYSQKLIASTVDALETVSKKAIKKTAETTGDLIGNKIANEAAKL